MSWTWRTRRIALIGYDGLTALDLTGPAEVFATASSLLSNGTSRRSPAYSVIVAGLDYPRFTTESGLSMLADVRLSALPVCDTLIFPGGSGLREPNRLSRAAKWLRERHKSFRRVASVCTGAYALAEAGLLNNARATTHWRFAPEFARRYPAIGVVVDALYLRHDRIYTSAGITAGIDLCLALVEEDHGSACALAVARELVVHLKRAGGQRQFSDRLALRGTDDERMANLCAWIQHHLSEDLNADRLALQCHCSTRQLGRRFRHAFAMSPLAYVEQLRIEEASQRLIDGTSGIERIARAVGFRTADVFRRAFERHYGIAPLQYRSRFSYPSASDQS
jgi:transcriptional regulator GlxA family with amidase domain